MPDNTRDDAQDQAEQGGLTRRDFVSMSIAAGVVAAAGTPQPILDAYNKVMGDVAKSATVQANLGRMGCAPLPMSAPEFSGRIRSDHAKYSALAKSVGMKID